MIRQKTLKVCRNGHRFYKSSDCPTCPQCEKKQKPEENFLSLVGAPARRALNSLGIDSEKKLAAYSEKEIMALHGMGKASLPVLRSALKKAGLKFKKEG